MSSAIISGVPAALLTFVTVLRFPTSTTHQGITVDDTGIRVEQRAKWWFRGRAELGVMAAQVQAAVLDRVRRDGRSTEADGLLRTRQLIQYDHRDEAGPLRRVREVATEERPPHVPIGGARRAR